MRLHSPATRYTQIQLSKSADIRPVTASTKACSGLVELMGIEPTTPGLQSRCSPS
jgi:hypothetical protein